MPDLLAQRLSTDRPSSAFPGKLRAGGAPIPRDRPYPQLQSCSRNSDWEHENQQCLLHIGSPPRLFSSAGNCCNQAWVLKNSLFVPNRQNLGDRKCLPNPRRSIVGLPDEILFLLISREGVLQQPRLVSSIAERRR